MSINDSVQTLDVHPITLEEYEAFASSLDVNPLHASGMYRRLQLQGHDARIYGGFAGGRLKIAVLTKLIKAWKIFHWLYAPLGFVMDDYSDFDLIKSFMEGLTPLMKKENTLYFRMECVVELHEHDQNGDIVVEGFDNESWREGMEHAGFELSDLWDGYDSSRQARWASVLDLVRWKDGSRGFPARAAQLADFDENFEVLTPEEIMKNMELKTRQSLKLSQRPYIKVRTLKENELDLLQLLEHSAADHHGFQSNSMAVDRWLYEGYGDQCEVLYAWLDVPAYASYMHDQYDQAKAHMVDRQKKYEESPGRRNKKALNTAMQDLEVLDKKMEELAEIQAAHPKEIPLSAAMFLKTPTETLYLTSGSNREFMRFAGAYAIQWRAIQDSLARKALRYNFWGISGIFDPEDPSYGVFAFKKGFNARVVEYAGEFTWVFMPKMTALYEAYINRRG